MVSYHRPNDLKLSVDSILDKTLIPFHLSIIDNSAKAIDNCLNDYANHPNITIYKNDKNIGKAAAINKWFHKIMANNQNDFFISIDSDIQVEKGWLLEMYKCYYRIKQHIPVGLIAPAICNNLSQNWDYQIKNKHFIIHKAANIKPYYHIYPGLYHNVTNGGGLLAINIQFFIDNDLYYDERLYGGDDGQLCLAAYKKGLFVGINSNVLARHTNIDHDDGYVQWKLRNVSKVIDKYGHWG